MSTVGGESKEKEVTNIMLDLFNQESQFRRYVECYAENYGDEREQKGIGIGREQGIGIGLERGARKTAYKLHNMGFPYDKIAEAVDVDIDTVFRWLRASCQGSTD